VCADCAAAFQIVRDGSSQIDLTITDHKAELLIRYCELLRRANRVMNLTAHRTPEAIMRRLVLDSVTILAALPDDLAGASAQIRVVDVGSGAGIPGIPLKIMRPSWSVALVESVGKKARFLRSTAAELCLDNVAVANARAEELGRQKTWRDAADLVLARAVAPLPTLVELCAPLARRGGLLALPKGARAATEVLQAQSAAQAVNLAFERSVSVAGAIDKEVDHVIVLYWKIGPTPSGYPRRVGLARSRPILDES
jgi:16S rRNA (guanine527-N7)-methyltransferase